MQISKISLPGVLGSSLFHPAQLPPKLYTFAAKQTLILGTHFSQPFYLIQWGVIKQVIYLEDGQERTLSLLGSGDLLWNFNPENIWAITLERTQINCLSAEPLQNQLPFPNIESILAIFAEKYQQVIQLFESDQKPRTQRVIENLLRIAQLVASPGVAEIKLPAWTQKELPALTGLTPETVSRVLSHLRRKGIIKGNRGNLVLGTTAFKKLDIILN